LVGLAVGKCDGALLGRNVVGRYDGDVVGNDDGTFVGVDEVGDAVVTQHPQTSALDTRGGLFRRWKLNLT